MNTKDYRLHQSFCFFVLIYRCITFQHLLKIENRVYTYKLKDLRKISDYRKREKNYCYCSARHLIHVKFWSVTEQIIENTHCCWFWSSCWHWKMHEHLIEVLFFNISPQYTHQSIIPVRYNDLVNYSMQSYTLFSHTAVWYGVAHNWTVRLRDSEKENNSYYQFR